MIFIPFLKSLALVICCPGGGGRFNIERSRAFAITSGSAKELIRCKYFGSSFSSSDSSQFYNWIALAIKLLKLSKSDLGKLQFLQNSAAHIVTNASRYSSITPALKKLHWLPVEQHCVFKTVTLVYKFLKTGFPQYFAPFLYQQKSLYNT